MATKKFPNAPQHPERICWGCDLYCPAKDMRCGNGSDRTPHPAELFGDGWAEWGAEESLRGSSGASQGVSGS
jgi:hypothetical protein